MQYMLGYNGGVVVEFATLQKVFLVVFFLITAITLVFVFPLMLSQWDLEQRKYEVGKQIADKKERISQIRALLRKTDDPQVKQQLEQEMEELRQQVASLEQEAKTLDEEMKALMDSLEGRRFIGLVLMLPNLIVAGVVTVAGCLRIRSEEEDKLFK
ncbi:MAG: hypothetical protein QW791_07240 [Candidatus Bathyarchaeia archaeon]